MALPEWPTGVKYAPDLNSISEIKRMLDPIKTEMEGGNVRLRSRPGDNVGTLSQTVTMPISQFDTFVQFAKVTLGNGTARFRMPVRLVGSFETKVCQFTNGGPTYKPVGTRSIAVSMSLRVYDL